MLILAGVLSPLDLPLVDTANFVGYVLWSVWLVVFAVVLLVRSAADRRPVAAVEPRRDRGPGPMTAAHHAIRAAPARGPSGRPASSPSRSPASPGGLVAGPVDDLVAAVLGGAVTGLVVGLGQSLGAGPAGLGLAER